MFATRQGYALTVAKSIEKGVSTMCLSDSNAAIDQEPTCDLHLSSREQDNFKIVRPPGRA